MKKIVSSLLAVLLTASLIGNAQADQGRRHGHDYRPSHSDRHHRHYQAPPRVVHQDRHHWIGPAAVLALGSLTIGTAWQYERAPAIVYAPRPTPSGSWYFCASSGMYYPYTRACPEGWQAVAPR